MTMLDGTLPVCPFHPDGFVGRLEADGQQVRVAALACDTEQVIALSLVGFDTSIGVVLARLWSLTSVPFAPATAWQEEWSGPERLKRLPGTREVHTIALPLSTHIAEGILHPPDLPKPKEEVESSPAARRATSPIQVAEVDRTRFVLGNWDEPTPHKRSFLGQLYAMRVMFLHRDHEHPAWADSWADELWSRGLSRQLIHPLKALGMKAWMLSGDLTAWSQLIKDGVSSGWLPWRDSSTIV